MKIKKLTIKYSKEGDINKSIYKKVIQIKTRLLISGDLAYFATIVGKVNMSGCWCHWCNLSAKEWSDKSHIKGMLWTIDLLKKSFNDKENNVNKTRYEKKGSVKKLLFDSVPIENYIFSLLHAEIGVGNKIVYTYFDWINERIEPITDEELELTNDLIDLKVDSKNYVKDYEEWIKKFRSVLA